MRMSLEEEKNESQKQGIMGLFKKEHNDEMSQILAFGEKYKEEGERMKEEFWRGYKISKYFDDRQIFFNLLGQYNESKWDFERGLPPEEKKLLDSLDGVEKEMFYEKFLFDRILYSGNPDRRSFGMKEDFNGYSFMDPGSLETIITWVKGEFEPLFKAEFSGANIGVAGAELLVKEWKDELKPGMQIMLDRSNIGVKGVEILAKGWKNSLQQGMLIDLSSNYFGVQGIKTIVEEWKDSLKVGMQLKLCWNNIGDEGVEILAKQRKGKLQPGMVIDLSYNDIGDEGLKALTEEWKGELPPGFDINLKDDGISDKGVQYIMDNWELNGGVKINLYGNISPQMEEKLENWVQREYKDKGINCEVIVESLVN